MHSSRYFLVCSEHQKYIASQLVTNVYEDTVRVRRLCAQRGYFILGIWGQPHWWGNIEAETQRKEEMELTPAFGVLHVCWVNKCLIEFAKISRDLIRPHNLVQEFLRRAP